jgi:hypothetical protein
MKENATNGRKRQKAEKQKALSAFCFSAFLRALD